MFCFQGKEWLPKCAKISSPQSCTTTLPSLTVTSPGRLFPVSRQTSRISTPHSKSLSPKVVPTSRCLILSHNELYFPCRSTLSNPSNRVHGVALFHLARHDRYCTDGPTHCHRVRNISQLILKKNVQRHTNPGLTFILVLFSLIFHLNTYILRGQVDRATAVGEESISNIRTVRSLAMENTKQCLYNKEVQKAQALNESIGIGIGFFQVMALLMEGNCCLQLTSIISHCS